MASKQLGKLRQWAGEVISTRDKTIVSDEFKDLEHDVELRRQGLLKLHVTSEVYHHSLSKKKECEVLPGDKLLPLDSLGVVMIQHGEEFGDESAFGTSLVSLGRAHCQIATLQETFAISFEDTYLKAIKRSEADIKEYQNERKKLESRRLSYDAALAKYEKLKDNKNSKKDKERREAEDEYELAKLRFEETQEDVEARMHNIQENEVTQLRDLTNLLNLEISFVQQHLDVLRDVKVNWIDEDLISQMEASHKRTRRSPPPPAPPSVIPLSSSRSNEDEPAILSRFNSTRSKSSQPPGTPKSHSRRSSKAASPVDTSSSSESGSEGDSESDPGESDGGAKKKKGGLRERARSLTKRRKSDAGSKNGSRAPSRSASMKGRKRADSEATVGWEG
ncbi:hypothetical protein NLI96_g8628 [Meripilus lineatus]|uniref:BAR domain-containing protein n=1 Tax=Meripilus lineatus TaxID=2056292 RepID=A0AAD5YG41_9APHY|nr:hypothetical protein NLI96_g8628 [Physisporinus lineatus]